MAKLYIGDTAYKVMLGDNSGHIADPLPYDYEVEYLESSGEQYIDTGILSYDDLRIESKWHLSPVDGTVFYGIRHNQSTISAGGSTRNTGVARWGSTAYISIIGSGDLEIIQDASGINVNGTSYTYSAREIVLPAEGHTMFLFAWRNASDNASAFTKAKCYYYKVYKNNALIQDLIPVVKDKVPCMYDKVTKTFFYNQGTGSFIAGPRVGGVHIVWNQLLRRNNQSGATVNGVTFAYDSDGTVVASGTATANTWGAQAFNIFSKIIGHKYMLLGGIDSTHSIEDGEGFIGDKGNGSYLIATNTHIIKICVVMRTGATADNLVFKPKLFDLTQMFGEGNEPTSVEQFQQWFTDNIGSLDDVYPYNAGEEIKVKYLPKDM